MCLALCISNPDFLGQSNAVNTLRQISMLGIFAIGIGFVIITGGIDLSIGSVIGLTGVIIAKLSSPAAGGLGYSLWIGIRVALGVGAAHRPRAGAAHHAAQAAAVHRHARRHAAHPRRLADDRRRAARSASAARRCSTSPTAGSFHVGGDPLMPYPLIIFLARDRASATYVLHFTVFGRYVYAIGGNRDAAEYSGINVKTVETITYVISAGLGGVAGVCYAAYIGQMSQQVGVAYELYAIAAAVLGGCSLRGGEGTVLGIVIGSAMMRVIDNGINMFQVRYEDERRDPAHLAPQPELDVHHHRRRDPGRGDPRPGRAPGAGDPAHARGAVNGDANSRRESDERAVRRNAARVFPQGRTPSSVSAARTSPPTSAWSRAAWARCTERRIRGSIAWRLRPRNAEGLRSVPVRGFGGIGSQGLCVECHFECHCADKIDRRTQKEASVSRN